jgi:hypothetical protein
VAEFIAGGRTVPAGNGWRWLVEGWGLFVRAPGIWIAVTLLWALVALAVALIPILGSIASIILGEVFIAGLVIGCRSLDEGGELKVEHLFAGFREHFGTLVSVGLLYLAAMIVVTLITGLLVGFKLYALLSSEQVVSGQIDPVVLFEFVMTVLLAVLIWLALMLPVFMAIWFTPVLVVFQGQGALAAIKSSFIGCLRNILPSLVYGLILFVAAIVATIPLGLGWLVLGPVVVGSLYASYRDIYFTS